MYAKWDKINVPFFSNLLEFKIYLFKIPNHFLRNPFFELWQESQSILCHGRKEKRKKMSLKELKDVYVHDEIIALWKWWFEREKNLSLNVIVYIHFYQQRTFLSQEAMFLFFFHVHDFIFLHCIYISNLKIHYGMASCRFDNLFFCLFLSIL